MGLLGVRKLEEKEKLGEEQKVGVRQGPPLFLSPQSTSIAVTRPTDGSVSTVTIMYTCMVQYANCVQLFNVIFRRILRHLDMKQVGRYYYDPYNPIAIPQHKYVM